MEFSLSDYIKNEKSGNLQSPNYFNNIAYINKKKYLKLKDLHDKQGNTIENALTQIKKRVDDKTFYHIEPLQSRALSYSSASFPAYRFILPEIITEDWLAIVDWHKFQRDHIIHQPLVSYIVEKLLGFGNDEKKDGELNLLSLCLDSILSWDQTSYIKKYLSQLFDGKSNSFLTNLVNPQHSRPLWQSLFYQSAYVAALFHDLGYPWQYLNILNSKIDYLGNNGSEIPTNDAENTIKKYSNRLLFYPLNGYQKNNSPMPSNWASDLLKITNTALHKSHGLPGAIGFLHLNDSISDFPNRHNPLWQFCIEWASIAIMMHDMAKLYWSDLTKEPEWPHLRLNIKKDPISFIVTLADFLQEFERPVAEFNSNNKEVKIQYKYSCTKTKLDFSVANSLNIIFYYNDKIELIKKKSFIENDFKLYFDPQYGYLDMSSIGINKMSYELEYDLTTPKVIICKNLDPNMAIRSLKEWLLKCPPQRKDLHWKKGRSAMETAKLWLRGIPKEFLEILRNRDLEIELCSPELNTRFDTYNGNVRNHDLLIIAKDLKNEKAVVSIESKVDEPFDKTIGPYLRTILREKEKGINSNVDKRIEDLRKAIFPQVDIKVFESLKYQLLTAVAGTLCEAKIQGAKTAFFLVQTLITSNIDEGKHRKNQRDLDSFIKVVSNGNYLNIHDNDLVGPFKFKGNQFMPDDVELWIGKYSIGI